MIRWVRELVVALVVVGSPGVSMAQSNPALADYWDKQKQRALRGMDDAVNTKAQCRTEYRTDVGIKSCENAQDRWHRFWNERYIEATREYDKYR